MRATKRHKSHSNHVSQNENMDMLQARRGTRRVGADYPSSGSEGRFAGYTCPMQTSISNAFQSSRCVQINELEQELEEAEERNKRNGWASTELERIKKSNDNWKDYCKELQAQIVSSMTERCDHERELNLQIATSEQQVTDLLDKQVHIRLPR